MRLPLLLPLLLLAACTGSDAHPVRTAAMLAPPDSDLVRTYVGRFSIDLPRGLHTGYPGGTLRGVRIESYPWPDSAGVPLTFEQEWQRQRDTLRADLYGPLGVDSLFIEQRSLAPQLRALLYYDSDIPIDRSWLVLQQVGDLALLFRRRVTEGEEAAGLEHLLAVARSFRPFGRNPQAVIDAPEPRFFVHGGAFFLPPDEEEEAGVGSEGDLPGGGRVRIGFGADAGEAGDDSEFAERRQFLLTTTDPRIAWVRGGERGPEGYRGAEVIVRVTENGHRSLRATWEYSGSRGVAIRPMVDLMLTAHDYTNGRYDEALALHLWDRVLGSVRPVAGQQAPVRAQR